MARAGTPKSQIGLGPAKAALDNLREITMRNAQFRKDMIEAIERKGYIIWKGRKLRIVDDATGLSSNEIRYNEADA